MGLLDAAVDKAFCEENARRVVVFRGGSRNRGYVVKSESEEAKIRSFLKMFYFAEYAIALFGSSLAFAWSTFFANLESLGKPEEHLFRTGYIYFGINALLVGIPSWLLWRSYKKSCLSFVAGGEEVVVSGKNPARRSWAGYIVLAIAFVFLAAVLFYLVRAK
jgi:hypothetical protein